MNHAYQKINFMDLEYEVSDSLFTPFENNLLNGPIEQCQETFSDPILELNELQEDTIKSTTNLMISEQSTQFIYY
jgi:hypothetical protein